jgi:hypothetical protein
MAVNFFTDGGLLSAGNAVGALDNTSTSTMDIIFAPIRPPEGGLALFKAIKIRLSTNNSGGVPTVLKVYKKGNLPKDSGDAPDYSVSQTVGNGDTIFDLPHIVTEELIIRLMFTLTNSYDTLLPSEMSDKIRSLSSPRVRLLKLWIDMEKYGDTVNIHEGGWNP